MRANAVFSVRLRGVIWKPFREGYIVQYSVAYLEWRSFFYTFCAKCHALIGCGMCGNVVPHLIVPFFTRFAVM